MFRWFWVQNESEVEENISPEENNEGDQGQVVVDVLEDNKNLYIFCPIAGVQMDDIDIGIEENILHISGSRDVPEEYNSDATTLVSECFFGSFSRKIILPENVLFNKIEAYMEDNLLKIVLPKIISPASSIKIKRLEK